MMLAAIALLALLALGKRAPTSTPSSTSSSTTRATETTATPEAALRHARRSVRSHPASSTSTSSSSSSVFNPAPSDSARAANELGSFLAANPSALRTSSLTVAALQARMGSLVADGLVGPATRARAKALGVVLP